MEATKKLNLQQPKAKTKNSFFFKYGLWAIAINFALFTILFYVFGRASISYSHLAPFAFGLFFALIYCKFNIFNLSVSYMVGYGLATFSLIGLYSALGAVAIALIVWLIHRQIKKKINKITVGIYGILSQWVYIWLNSTSLEQGIAVAISVVLGVFFLYASVHFLSATIVRGYNFKLASDEAICGCIILAVFAMGLASISPFGVEFSKIFLTLLIFLSTYLFTGISPILIAFSSGIGVGLYTGNIIYTATFITFALLSLAFKTNHKIFSCIAVILVEVVLGLYFKAYPLFSVWSIVSVAIAGGLFLLTPLNIFSKAVDMLGGYREKLAIRSVVNRSKQGICRRMNEIANVFLEMDTVFRSMVRGSLSEEDAKAMLTHEIVDNCCKSCPEKNNCLRANGKYTTEVLSSIVDAGFERGKATLLDVPQYLASKCGKINSIISTTNQILNNYKQHVSMVHNIDSSRILIAEQLNGVGGILRNLANEVNLNISFDVERETRIIEELSYKNIFCVEALVYEENIWNKNVTLILRNENIDNGIIEKIISKICNSKLAVTEASTATIPNCVLVNLRTCANYDIVFGQASCSKSGIVCSGDTHSLTKIEEGRYMIAICDGMGSGEHAEKYSSLAISLIENFYKAGFDNEIILSSVNRLLSLNNEERFSALDICVLDLRQNTCDFIKLGAPYGFIKRKLSTEIVETSGLPIGVLEEMKPHIVKTIVQDFDNIILVSDGITDAYGSKEQLQSFINNINTNNPQKMADEILDQAMDILHGVSKDDMTVVVVRVFPLS